MHVKKSLVKNCAGHNHVPGLRDGIGGNGRKAYIIDEIHHLNRDCQRMLLGILEQLPTHVIVIRDVLAMRDRGLSLEKIAGTLTDRGIPTKRGNGRWNQATVRGLCKRNGDTRR